MSAEADFETFIRLVSPKQVMGHVHSEICSWWTRQGHGRYQLVLIPRDHQKSRLVAFRVAWEITKRPDIRVLYISSTANLAEKQLKFIKDLITSKIYRKYWPEMTHPDEAKRERWTTSEVSVDHPKRKEEGVRDPTIFTGGLTTNLVGMHCDIAVLDDVVTFDNAYTEEGRERVKQQYSLLSSIEGTDAEEWVVGTPYDPNDLYAEMLKMEEDFYDNFGNVTESTPIYEIFTRIVEDSTERNGIGQFLWPRQMRNDGKWFGFDSGILAKKRAQYLNKSQFFAQYYCDPNDSSDSPIDRTKFQYYNRDQLMRTGGHWFMGGKRLNVYAAIDFAYSVNRRSDYTALVVIGIAGDGNIYVLDIRRIKTDKISDYFKLILDAHIKWDFRKLRAETTAAQKAIVKELKSAYLQPQGISLPIDENASSNRDGSKAERINSILQHRYDAQRIWHFQGGECQSLEEELVLKRPPHDDIKDAFAAAVEIAVPPMGFATSQTRNPIAFNSRFGGIAL